MPPKVLSTEDSHAEENCFCDRAASITMNCKLPLQGDIRDTNAKSKLPFRMILSTKMIVADTNQYAMRLARGMISDHQSFLVQSEQTYKNFSELIEARELLLGREECSIRTRDTTTQACNQQNKTFKRCNHSLRLLL